jgi:CheY-like chemotaxis protein
MRTLKPLKTVLIIEDDQINRLYFKAILGKYQRGSPGGRGRDGGPGPPAEPNSRSSSSWIWGCPDMDGYETFTAYPGKRNRRRPIFAITAFATAEAEERTTATGLSGIPHQTLCGKLF